MFLSLKCPEGTQPLIWFVVVNIAFNIFFSDFKKKKIKNCFLNPPPPPVNLNVLAVRKSVTFCFSGRWGWIVCNFRILRKFEYNQISEGFTPDTPLPDTPPLFPRRGKFFLIFLLKAKYPPPPSSFFKKIGQARKLSGVKPSDLFFWGPN